MQVFNPKRKAALVAVRNLEMPRSTQHTVPYSAMRNRDSIYHAGNEAFTTTTLLIYEFWIFTLHLQVSNGLD